MTPAPTMQTRSTLPREYLSAVTCQSTACLHPSDEPFELGIGHEAAFLRAGALDRLEQRRIAVFGHVQPELGDLDPDRVEPALLAEDDPPLGAHELRGVRLYRGRVVELRRDRARLAREEVLAGHRLPGLQRRARELLHERAEPARLREVEPGGDP